MRQGSTLAGVLESRAAAEPGRPFLLLEEGVNFTLGEFNAQVNRVAHGLLAKGVARGDRVVCVLPNCPEFLLTSYALKKIGAVEVAINTSFRGNGLARVIDIGKASLLFVGAEHLLAVAEVRDQLRALRSLVVVGRVPADFAPPKDVEVLAFSDVLSDRTEDPGIVVRDTDLATILFTSGTTGPSKGCMLSHRYAMQMAQGLIDALHLGPRDCLFCAFPLYHADGALLTVAPALLLGGRAAIARRFSVRRFWDQIRQFDATVFDFMGATLTMLWKAEPRPDDADNPARLGWGVPMPSFRREFEQRFGIKLVHCYGLTDGNMISYESPDRNEPEGSCGRPRHPFYVEIHDEEDDEVPRGTIGEIVVRPLRADVVMKGYYGMPEDSLRAFRNLWLHTGDLGRMDEEGHLFFHSRQKDAIRRRGENISAWEIEEVVNAHPAVAESVAVGVPSELTEEDVKVFVALRPGSRLTADELRAYCEGKMAAYMTPQLVEFVDSIPKTPTGKPEKYKLVAASRGRAAADAP